LRRYNSRLDIPRAKKFLARFFFPLAMKIFPIAARNFPLAPGNKKTSAACSLEHAALELAMAGF